MIIPFHPVSQYGLNLPDGESFERQKSPGSLDGLGPPTPLSLTIPILSMLSLFSHVQTPFPRKGSVTSMKWFSDQSRIAHDKAVRLLRLGFKFFFFSFSRLFPKTSSLPHLRKIFSRTWIICFSLKSFFHNICYGRRKKEEIRSNQIGCLIAGNKPLTASRFRRSSIKHMARLRDRKLAKGFLPKSWVDPTAKMNHHSCLGCNQKVAWKKVDVKNAFPGISSLSIQPPPLLWSVES